MTTTGTSPVAPHAGAVAPRDVAGVRDRIRAAAAAGTPLRLAGAGTWLDAARPVTAASEVLSLGALAGIVEYVPGDLTLTARAGTTLEEIRAATGAHGQWLALDPFGDARATLGATIATASAGPLAHAFGGVRDNVLGLEAVTGTGEVIRGGGRVVKNVAGFDLVRLLTGAWGTLGAITEATVRLRALPEVDLTVLVELHDDPGLVRQLLDGLRRAALAPIALELLGGALSDRLGHGDRPMMAVRLAGNAELVQAQHALLSRIGATERAAADFWARLRAVEPPRAVTVRLSALPARMPETWMAALALAEWAGGGLVHAQAGRGVARVVVPMAAEALDERSLEGLEMALGVPFEGTRVYERLPATLWERLAPRGAAADRLSRGVRSAFDPAFLLNPGILGAGS